MMVMPHERLKHFEGMNDKSLYEWTGKFLSTFDPSPFILTESELKYSDSVEIITGLVRGSNDEVKQRYRGIVSELVNGWSEERDPLEYFSRLVVIAGRIRAIGAYDCLLNYANTGRFKGKADRYIGSDDVHVTILRVIWGQGITDEAKVVYERDIQDGRYATLCYNALFDIDLDNGVLYLPDIVKQASRGDLSAKLSSHVRHFLLRSKAEGNPKILGENLEGILSKLDPRESEILLHALGEIGFDTETGVWTDKMGRRTT